MKTNPSEIAGARFSQGRRAPFQRLEGPHPGNTAPAREQSLMSTSSEPPVFDYQTLQQLHELVDGDDASFLRELFESYLKCAEESIELLKGGRDHEAVRRAAHSLTGSSLNVGAVSVAQIARQLEVELTESQVANLTAQVGRLEAQLRRVVDAYPDAIANVASRASA